MAKFKEIIANIQGSIPNPIPKKFVKQASAGQKDAKQFVKEEVAGFADASAPSNSNYQTQLSPTQTAKKPRGTKKMKNVKEYYNRLVVELSKVCPECNNTGMVQKYGNNVLCGSCGGDERSDNPKIIGKQARDMLATGKTTAVKEDIVSSLEDIYPVLEAYQASAKLKSATKYLVQPKLSKMLRDRLAARAVSGKKKTKGYKASQGTLGLAAARRAQMSHSKENKPVKEDVVNEGEPSYVKPKSKYSYLKYMKAAPGTWAETQAKKKAEAKKKNVKEEVILEKSKDKSGIKRKYLGATRGRTATGKPAHPIEVDPVIKTNSDINKVVK